MTCAAIFDLDGLLADTEPLHSQSWRETLAACGVRLDKAEYSAHWIRDGKGIRDFLALRGLAHDPLELRRRKAVRYADLVTTSCRAMPGAMVLLQALHGRIPMALATSAYREDAMRALNVLGFSAFFDVIVTNEDAPRVKPFPDLFLVAAEKLNILPTRCVVLEDAEKGVRAATVAGMAVIAVPNESTRGNDFSSATLVVESLEAVDLPLILSLAGH